MKLSSIILLTVIFFLGSIYAQEVLRFSNQHPTFSTGADLQITGVKALPDTVISGVTVFTWLVYPSRDKRYRVYNVDNSFYEIGDPAGELVYLDAGYGYKLSACGATNDGEGLWLSVISIGGRPEILPDSVVYLSPQRAMADTLMETISSIKTLPQFGIGGDTYHTWLLFAQPDRYYRLVKANGDTLIFGDISGTKIDVRPSPGYRFSAAGIAGSYNVWATVARDPSYYQPVIMLPDTLTTDSTMAGAAKVENCSNVAVLLSADTVAHLSVLFSQATVLPGDSCFAEILVDTALAPGQYEFLQPVTAEYNGSQYTDTILVKVVVDSQTIVTGIGEGNSIPQKYQLKQNFPNPFNPATTIEYSLPEAGLVLINLYNSLGQKVRTLREANQPAGSYQVVWDGRNDSGSKVAGGVYIYRMNAGGKTFSRKMTLVK